jgi:phage portal protein BeeE
MSRLRRLLQTTSESTPSAALHKPFWSGNAGLISLGSLVGEKETIEGDFETLVQRAWKENGIVFACIAARAAVFAEARFAWRKFKDGRPGDPSGNAGLGVLERPWTNGTTAELLSGMEQDVSLAGNSFTALVKDEHGERLRRLRPDWTTIITGSPTDDPFDVRARPIGYVYRSPRAREPLLLSPNEVAHYSLTPDPVAQWRGVSWLSTVLPEVQADKAATKHKAKFFENGATLSTVLSYDATITPEDFQTYVDLFREKHEGTDNAYKTLHVGGGVSPNVIGADLRQLDFKATQGGGETRVAAAAGVHPVILGLSEGLGGSALNAGNYAQVRRRFADVTIRSLWRSASAALESLVEPPDEDSRLWYVTSDIPFLQDDAKQEAEIRDKQALTITRLVKEGFTSESTVEAVISGDWTVLEHTGLFSVQLQSAGSQEAP